VHNVHWTDPNFDLTWGLGFSVYKGDDGAKWVGHGGSCPGYRSTLQLNLKSKMAYSVMINAGGTNPRKYLRAIHAIMEKTEVVSDSDSDSEVNLNDYVGFYSGQPWGSERYIGTWNGKLVSLRLPSDNPVQDVTMYKYIKGDTFKRIKENGDSNANHSFEIILSKEYLHDAIEFAVKQHEIDLVVMGTKGVTGAKEIFFGSNTVDIIKKMKLCPILVIPDSKFSKLPNMLLVAENTFSK